MLSALTQIQLNVWNPGANESECKTFKNKICIEPYDDNNKMIMNEFNGLTCSSLLHWSHAVLDCF